MHGITKYTHLAVMTDTGTSYITCSSHSKVKRTQECSNVIHSNKTQMTLKCVRRCTKLNAQ